ncbi:MAG: class IV adenylate cyclase [Fervidicoccaceae archaeon]
MEVEVKIKISLEEYEELKKKLSIICKEINETEMSDTYFSHPCYDLAERDEAIRLRRTSTVSGKVISELTYKGKRMEAGYVKTRNEITVNVENDSTILQLLRALGFKEAIVVRKKRTEFDCSSYIVSLDEVSGLGTFIEIEGKEGCGPDCVMRARDSLGIKGTIERKTYLELLMEREAKRK